MIRRSSGATITCNTKSSLWYEVAGKISPDISLDDIWYQEVGFAVMFRNMLYVEMNTDPFYIRN